MRHAITKLAHIHFPASPESAQRILGLGEHPATVHLVGSPAIDGLSPGPGLYHYSPLLHALERRAAVDPDTWAALCGGLPAPCLLLGLSTIAWREAWKYGERAFRYCQHDLGHAIAAVALAAALQGWRAVELPAPDDAALAALLGLRPGAGPEPELPETLLLLVPGDAVLDPAALHRWTPPAAALARFAALPMCGEANQLSATHEAWPVIDEVSPAGGGSRTAVCAAPAGRGCRAGS